MNMQTFVSLCVFAVATSATPGPNNAMLFASGVNHGFRRTLPHLLGVTLGFTFMQLALGLGVGLVFEAAPWLYPLLRALGVVYMLYLAWAIGSAAPPAEAAPAGSGRGRPMTFLQATAFQWVNPKALMMCITAASTYSPPDQPVLGPLMVTGVFLVLGMPCCGAWAALGVAMRGLLQDRRRLRIFNAAMALGLVASMAPVIRDMLAEGWL